MAPKFRLSGSLQEILRITLKITVLLVYVTGISCLEDCPKPKCYFFTQRNVTARVDVRAAKEQKNSYTTFCFEGLTLTYFRLWSNPVLQISRPETLWNESRTFLTYFGDSVASVETRKQQPGYIILQTFMSSIRTFKQNEDFALSPFNLSCYIIETDVNYKAKIHVKGFDLWFLAYLAAGIILFFSAKTWSQ